MGEAIADIAAERARQISAEGWTPGHDDEHGAGELARAAACYALLADRANNQTLTNLWQSKVIGDLEAGGRAAIAHWPIYWPWDGAWWKPKNQRADLVRAGALIVAEIERLDRAALAKACPTPTVAATDNEGGER